MGNCGCSGEWDDEDEPVNFQRKRRLTVATGSGGSRMKSKEEDGGKKKKKKALWKPAVAEGPSSIISVDGM